MILERLAAAVEDAAPGAARALYVTGSFASGDTVDGSDLDIFAVLPRRTPRSRVGGLLRAVASFAAREGVAIDFKPIADAELAAGTSTCVLLKLGGRAFAGADLSAEIALPSVSRFIHDRMQNAACLVAYALRDPARAPALPLAYPTPADELFGYVRDGSTRDAVTIAGWAMNALVAKREHRYVISKHDALSSYAASGAPFAAFAQKLISQCRGAWGYRVPDGVEARSALRAIFEEMRAFEDYFLDCFGEHLAGVMRSGRSKGAIVAAALEAMIEEEGGLR